MGKTTNNKYSSNNPDLIKKQQEHHYQNQFKFDNNIYFSSQEQQPQQKHKNNKYKSKNSQQFINGYSTNNQPFKFTSHNNLNNQPNQVHISSDIASSNASSHVNLILDHKEITVSYCFLVTAILFMTISMILIAITFIFPFWIKLTFELKQLNNNSSPYSILNITNLDNKMSLLARNESKIDIDLGIWEVKMRQSLEIFDSNTRLVYKNAFPQPMLWLNSDLNNQVDSFLIKLLAFIDLKSVNLFTVQILEIMHLIFTFLTLCFTSFTLCLCTTQKSSVCWYLVSFFMSLISFFTGLAVLILIVLWHQLSTEPNYKYVIMNQNYELIKHLNWCFWCAVGINSLILLSAFLILLYLLISVAVSYKNKKYLNKRRRLLAEENSKSYIGQKSSRNFNTLGVDSVNLDVPTKLPRYEASFRVQPDASNMSRASTALVPNANERVLIQSSTHTIQQNETLNSPSYIFYTGHGNYRKQSIDLEINQEQIQQTQQPSPDYEPAKDFIKPSALFSTASQRQSNDHSYSNVLDQTQGEFKFKSYR